MKQKTRLMLRKVLLETMYTARELPKKETPKLVKKLLEDFDSNYDIRQSSLKVWN